MQPPPQNGELMPQYLVAVHHPDHFDPSTEAAETVRDIHALNREMIAAGVRFFAGGLQQETKAKSLRAQPNGEVLITDGPYLEAKEHVGGFWILEVADLDEALAWAPQGCHRLPDDGEVREFIEGPAGRHTSPIAPTPAKAVSTPPTAKPAPPPTSTKVSATATSASSWCGVVVSRHLPRDSVHDGLHQLSKAARISFSRNKPAVMDSPSIRGKQCGKRRLLK